MPIVSPSPDSARVWLATLLRGEVPIAPALAESILLDTARTEGVLALCHNRLRQSPAWAQYPVTLRVALTRYAYQDIAVEMAREMDLRDVLDALARQSLPVLLLKGEALACMLYPEPHLRNRCDTDLLFPSREEAEHAWCVLQTLGYQRAGAMSGDLISYELCCHKTGHGGLAHTLDLHWRWSNAALFAERFTFAELAASAVPIPALGPQAHGLSLVHALLLACVHRFVSLGGGMADRLIWLYDIHLLAQRLTDEPWQQFMALAEERTLCGPCLDGLDSARIWFGTSLSDAVLSRLRAGTDREGFDPRQLRPRWRYEWQTFRALPSTALRLRWLGQHLCPTATYLRSQFNVRNPLWLPWFYGMRIVRGAGKLFHQSRTINSR